MNKVLSLLTVTLLLLSACENPGSSNNQNGTAGGSGTTQGFSGPPPTDSSFIPVDSANKMIGSFLTSVSSDSNSLHSLILDAASLRAYLTSDSGKNITNVKIMFAHSLDYINNGNKGVNCGYNTGELTAVMAGYNSQGNYVYWPTRMVIDRMFGCPHFCPVVGQAMSDLLP